MNKKIRKNGVKSHQNGAILKLGYSVISLAGTTDRKMHGPPALTAFGEHGRKSATVITCSQRD
jgi:hypothetical protein